MKLFLLLISLLFSTAIYADVSITQVTPQATVDTFVFSDITPVSFAKLTIDQQKQIADEWHLTVTDYQQYLWLMNNTPSAVYYKDKNLDPSWILGFNAKDEKERQKFVVIAIQNERERIAKELLFQQDFTRLQQELYPDQSPILWPAKTK